MNLEAEFEALLVADQPPDVLAFLAEHGGAPLRERVAVIMVDQRHRHRVGNPRPIEDYLQGTPEIADDSEQLLNLLEREYRLLELGNRGMSATEFADRFPAVRQPLLERIGDQNSGASDHGASDHPEMSVTHVSEFPGGGSAGSGEAEIRHGVTVRKSQRDSTMVSGDVARDESLCDVEPTDGRIGRYRVSRVLGEGGFGRVYLAHDDELERNVAIKVPHQHRVRTTAASEEYFDEARMLASLDHPNIVPVYDVGRTASGVCYVVSKFIEGDTLTVYANRVHATRSEIAQIIAQVAEALHYAHTRGLIHRDIKPGNILVDTSGTTFVIDFGLALKEEDYGTGAKFLGTPAYMSPEQARGEGHLADARSDVFSLGSVLYLLLTGNRPFVGSTSREIIEQVMRKEPRPPRVVDRTIPRELERICFKALAKRAVDRYTTALDMAEDLRVYVADKQANTTQPPASVNVIDPSLNSRSTSSSSSGGQIVQIVPKGLRAFDGDDADFFLALLPGAKDRDGLPDSIRFWKTQMAERDADQTFRVGLIYGPSGCGKSSLVKAGLLPRLDQHIAPVYVEATAEDTEKRILNGIRKRASALSDQGDLVDAMSLVRRGKGVSSGRKIVILIDQFEQWLHAHGEDSDSQLVRALRQCDGENLQCVLMVRDDFWLAASRLMRELEVDQIEGRNMATVDLFDKLHARKVLIAFGRAFDRLPDDSNELTKEQTSFVDAAIDGLSDNGKVIPVRLALFAEMVKGRRWVAETLKELGGISGVGVTFLEETFSSATAPPAHRMHEEAVRRVLQALLPEEGTNIKGHMRSYSELLQASGYDKRPNDFRALQHLLDTELRLVTPTDPEGAAISGDSVSDVATNEKWYQLTHDYLVHSLREWLTQKQKESAAGRAELTLRERAELWNAKREQHRLPSLREWLSISALTKHGKWNEAQRRMMRAATRYHVAWCSIWLVVFAALGWIFYELQGRTRGDALVERLMTAETNQLIPTIEAFKGYRRWAEPKLKQALAESQVGSPERLRASLALLSVDDKQTDYLRQHLVQADPEIVLVIRDALDDDQRLAMKPWLWEKLGDAAESADVRFAAAIALATVDNPGKTPSEAWLKQAPFLAERLVNTITMRPDQYVAVREGLRPVRRLLFPALQPHYSTDSPYRTAATRALIDYVADSPDLIAQLILDANVEQFNAVFDLVEPFKQQVGQRLKNEFGPPTNQRAEAGLSRETKQRRRANAAIALLRLGQSDLVWPLFEHTQDDSVRSLLIHNLQPLNIPVDLLLRRLDQEDNDSVRRALLLCLGEFEFSALPVDRQRSMPERLSKWLIQDPDAGVHSCCEWLLRRWGKEDVLAAAERKLASKGPSSDRNWYVTQGESTRGELTMVVIDGRNAADVGRIFEIATKEVSRTQIQALPDRLYPNIERMPDPDCPASVMNWFQAIEYCQVLNELEGVPQDQWCYPPIDEIGEDDADLRRLTADLTKTGYRLPTSAEWQYACQAGSATSWPFGDSEQLLTQYAWTRTNANLRSWPGGILKPNDFGLFDMYGNVNEWLAEPAPDVEKMVLKRGGSFLTENSFTPYRTVGFITPHARRDSLGLRVARTHAE